MDLQAPRLVYTSNHEDALVVLVRLGEYSDRVLAARGCPVELVEELHALHLRVEALAGDFRLVKVDSHGGEVVLAGNLEPGSGACSPSAVLDFAREVVNAAHSARVSTEEHSQSKTGTIRVVLARGAVTGAILGKCGLRYALHGRPHVLAQQLANTITNHPVIATDDFLQGLTSTQAWVELGKQYLPGIGAINVYALGETNEENNSIRGTEGTTNVCKEENSFKGSNEGNGGRDKTHENVDTVAQEQSIKEQMNDGQPTGEEVFDLGQLKWLSQVRDEKMESSFQTFQTILWRTLEHGICSNKNTTVAFFVSVVAILMTLVPLFALTFTRWLNLQQRLWFLGTFRLFCIGTRFVNNFLA